MDQPGGGDMRVHLPEMDDQGSQPVFLQNDNRQPRTVISPSTPPRCFFRRAGGHRWQPLISTVSGLPMARHRFRQQPGRRAGPSAPWVWAYHREQDDDGILHSPWHHQGSGSCSSDTLSKHAPFKRPRSTPAAMPATCSARLAYRIRVWIDKLGNGRASLFRHSR